MSVRHRTQRPSQLEGDELAQNRMEAWQDDFEWRDDHTNYRDYLNYYEGDAGRYDENSGVEQDEDGFPRINLTQRSVDDQVYFVLRNLPDARLQASKTHLQTDMDPLERDLRLTNIQVTEDTMNSLVDTILEDNSYRDKVERAILDAGIFGSGYLFTEIDRDMSVIQSDELRGLLEKAKKGKNWTSKDAKRYKQLTQRPSVEYRDARNVLLMAGVRRFDSPRMLRCSHVQYFRTDSLRKRYSHVEGSDRIQPGGVHHFLDRDIDNDTPDNVDIDYTSLMTMWEIETFKDTVAVPGTNTTASFLNARMVKTVIAGDVLVEKRTWESTDGQMSLPVVPIQFRKSRRHPYGRSEAKSLIQSEKLVNRVRSMMYKSGLNSVRPNGVSIFAQQLGPQDQEELEESFEEGGPAFITGNMVGNEVSDIREIVQPHKFASSPLDPSLRQMMNIEMEAFRFNSAKGSEQAVDKARTGRGKRAQINFNDRPKNYSVLNVTGSIQRLYENIYEIIQVVYSDENTPANIAGSGGRQEVKLNQRLELQGMPVLKQDGTIQKDSSLKSEGNPDGMLQQDLSFVLNSTNFDMDAKVENRAELPFDIPSRHRLIRQLEKDRYLTHEFARELILSDELRLRDDMHRQNNMKKRNRRIAKMLRQRASGVGAQQTSEPEPESANNLPNEAIDRAQTEIQDNEQQ